MAGKVNLVCDARLGKYFKVTEKALLEAKKAINSKRKQEAKEILGMAENYISDAKHFKKQGHYINSFAALNYAHGWLDSGARLGIFDVKDDQLFTIK